MQVNMIACKCYIRLSSDLLRYYRSPLTGVGVRIVDFRECRTYSSLTRIQKRKEFLCNTAMVYTV